MNTQHRTLRGAIRIGVAALVLSILTLMLCSYPTFAQKGGGGSKPPAPTGLVAVSSAIRQITLTWNASAGATSYKVYRRLPADRRFTAIKTLTATTYLDPGLTANSTYVYTVTALNAAGESGASNTQTSLALAGLPAGADPAIVYCGGGSDPNGLYVVDANGANKTRVCLDTISDASWSPDGMKLVFTALTRASGDPYPFGIWVMNRDGTGRTKVAEGFASEAVGPAWSPVPAPDGKYKIAYADEGDVWVVNPDGTGRQQLTFTPNDYDTGLLEGAASWSPDATRLAVACERNLTFAPYWVDSLVVIDVASSGNGLIETGRATILEDPTGDTWIVSPEWCRTGDPAHGKPDLVAFVAYIWIGSNYDVYAYTANLAYPGIAQRMFPSFSGGHQDRVSWSPDDSQAVISSWSTLYKGATNGSNPTAFIPGYWPNWRRTP